MELIRTDELRCLIEKIAFASLVVFTSANSWYIDTLVDNLLVSARIHEPDARIAVFCSDDEGAEKCRALGIPYYARVSVPALAIDTCTSDTDSTTDAYTRLSFLKVVLCKFVLDCGYIPLYLDPDMAFKRPHTIQNLLNHFQGVDFVAAGQRAYMNSNILMARPRAAWLFSVTAADVDAVVRAPDLHGDEDYFRPRLALGHVEWRTVKRREYPQGCDEIAEDARMVHANCVNGLENKIRQLKRWGAWYAAPRPLALEFTRPALVRYPHFLEGELFEEYFAHRYARAGGGQGAQRCCLNATWTNLYCNAQFSGEEYDASKLQDELDALDAIGRYFTIVQFDEGVKYHRLPPDTLVFGCCDGDVPIPLVYESSVLTPSAAAKTLFCSFVGSVTHPVRAQMLAQLALLPRARYKYTIATDEYDLFVAETRAARFCLAPRGFGRASFRFYEALKLGSVPVYIWDDVEWLPFKEVIDYGRLCVSVHVSQLPHLDAILSAITAEEYAAMQQYYGTIEHLFTFEGMYEHILGRVGDQK